jgi:hypothetical protein
MERISKNLQTSNFKYAKSPKDSMQRHVLGIESVDNQRDYLGQYVCWCIMITSNVRAVRRAINHMKLTDDVKNK